MSTTTLIVIAVIVFAFIAAMVSDEIIRRKRRFKPQTPPGDVSDRSRFDAIKRDWENKH